MSYQQTVIFRCDGCGLQITKDNVQPPIGWSQPASIFGQQAGPHLCGDCVKLALSARQSHMVPVEYQLK